MKKTYFKKSLSVIMAVLMIMSCWVFVAPEHNHADAAMATIESYAQEVTGYVNIDPVIYVHGAYGGSTTSEYAYMMNGTVIADGTVTGEMSTAVTVNGGKTISKVECVETTNVLSVSNGVLTSQLGGSYGTIDQTTTNSKATLKFTFTDGTFEYHKVSVLANPVAQHSVVLGLDYHNDKRRSVGFEVLAVGSTGQNADGKYVDKSFSDITSGWEYKTNFPVMYTPYNSNYKYDNKEKESPLVAGINDGSIITTDRVAGYHAMNRFKENGSSKYIADTLTSPTATYYLDKSSAKNQGVTYNSSTGKATVKLLIGNIYAGGSYASVDNIYYWTINGVGANNTSADTFTLTSEIGNITDTSNAFSKNKQSQGYATITHTIGSSDINNTFTIAYQSGSGPYVRELISMPYQIKVVDYSKLRNLYNEYVGKKLVAGNYTSKTWATYTAALQKAELWLSCNADSTVAEKTAQTQDQVYNELLNAFNSLKARNYDFNYENLFSFSEWAASDSATMTRGTLTYDLVDGKLTTKSISESQKDTSFDDPNNQDTYTAHGNGNAYYYIAVDPSKQYTFEYTVDEPNNHQCYVFFADSSYNALSGSDWFVNHGSATSSGNTKKITFTPPANAAYVQVRFGSTGAWDCSRTFSNIALYETARAEKIHLSNWNSRQYRKAFSYGEALATDYVPVNPGYVFDHWEIDTNGAGTLMPLSDFNTTVKASYVLYSTWKNTYAYDVNYENLFSLSNWVNAVAGQNLGYGTWSVDIDSGLLTLNQTKAKETDKDYRDNTLVAWNYDIPVTAGKTYTFEFDCAVEEGSGVQVHLFLNDSTSGTDWQYYAGSGNVPATEGSPYFRSTSKGNKITFTVPEGKTNLNVRFGTCDAYDVTNTISNIRLYETSKATELGKITNLKVRDVISNDMTLLEPKKAGYTFSGWFTDPSFSGSKLTVDAVKELTAGTTLYAKWSSKTYTLKYDANGGTGTMADESGKRCDIAYTLAPNKFTKTGYTFAGWNTKADGTGDSYADKASVQFETDESTVTLYAQWTINQYTVKFVKADGTTASEAKYNYGTKASDIKVPDNTANKSSNALQHYVYSWPEVKDLGAADVTYEEIGTLENHTIKYKDPTAAQHTEYCTECNYTSDKDHSGGSATCTEQATCQYCGTKYGTAKGHDWSTTYTSNGDGKTNTHYQTCTREGCGVMNTAVAHSWNDGVIKPDSTCTSTGTKTYTCKANGCGATYTEEVGKKSHKLTKTEAKDAKCEEDGNKEYWTCSECGKYFSDANGTTEIKLADTVITKLGHDYTGAVKSDGNGEKETHSYLCKNGCGTYGGATAHKWGTGVVKPAATCTENGTETFTCTVEGCKATYTKTVPATGHSFTQENATDDYLATEATCTDAATYYKSCTACGLSSKGTADKATFKSGDALGHSFAQANGVKSNNDGTHSFKCVRCDTYGTDTTVGGSAACSGGTANCVDKAKCTVCKTAYGEVDNENHKNVVTVTGYAATCESDGKTDGKHCDACNVDTVVQDTIPATGHKFDGYCVKVGDSTHAYRCTNTNCDKTGVAGQAGSTEACYGEGMTKVDQIANDETYHKVTCKCGNSKEVAHTWGSWTADPENKDNNQGKMSCTCSVCGYKKTSNCKYVEVEDSYQAPTCTDKGHRTWKCNDCGNGYTEIIDATKHSFGDTTVAKDANCTESGNTAYKHCSKCNKYFAGNAETTATDGKDDASSFTIPAKGHTFTATIVDEKYLASAQSCEAKATYYVSCSVCGASSKDATDEKTFETGNVLGHSFSVEVEGTRTDATCTADGSVTMKCSRCEKTENKTITKLGHEMTKTEAEEAKCEEDGNNEYYTCSRCSGVFKDEKGETATSVEDEKIDALGHDYDETKSETNLTRPVYDEETGTWSKGYYTHVCSHDASHTTKEYVDRADYTDYDKAISDLEKLLEQDLSDEAKENIEKALEEANKLPDNLIDSEQDKINKAVEGINKAIEDNTGNLKTYTVTFVDDDGQTLKTESVISGNDATAPINVTKTADETYHYTFNGWDKSFTNVTSDLTVKAKFTSAEHNFTTHTDKDDNVHTDKCDCGYTVDVSHGYNDGVITTPAKCEEKGVKTYTCSICQGTKTEYVDAIAHKNKEHHEAVPATCIATGTIEYWSCPDCSTNYSDEACTTAVTDLTAAINPNNHKNTEEKEQQDATCTDDGYTAGKYCNDCKTWVSGHEKIDALGHNLSKTDAKAATCKDTGNQAYWTCSVCGDVFSDENGTNQTTAADMTLGIDANNHVGDTEVRGTKTANCHEKGYTGDTYCLGCGNVKANGTETEIDKTNHVGGTKVEKEDTVSGTCKTAETWNEVTYCLGCNDVLKTEPKTGEINKDNHEDTTEVRGYKAADCGNNGYTGDTYYKCCDALVSKGEVIPATGEHKYGFTSHSEPTCTGSGLHVETCTVCGDVKKTTIDPAGHDCSKTSVAATCKVQAHNHYQCKNCDYNYDDGFNGPLAPHSWFELDPGKEPTCTETGLTAHEECLVCGDEKKATTIPMLGHSDKDGDGVCDNCDGTMLNGSHACGCICHKDSFIMRIIYAIARFFWKIFKINKTCSCGRVHY